MNRKLLVPFSFLFLPLLLGISSCMRFKMEELSPSLVAKIRIGNELDMIQAEITNHALLNVPLKIPLSSDRLYIMDYKNALLKVFLKNGSLDYIIGKVPTKGSYRMIDLKLITPGLVGVSDDDKVYIQNRISPAISTDEEIPDRFMLNSGYFSKREMIHVPSYLQEWSQKTGEFSNIGMNGKNSEPFRYIEAIYTGSNQKLFVLHRVAEEMILSYFENGILKGSLTEWEIMNLPENPSGKYKMNLETLIPQKNGENVLASIRFMGLEDERFKFRRIYLFKIERKLEKPILLKELQDPSEILFGVKQSGEFFIWETEPGSNDVKLQLHDKEGNHIKNFRMDFENQRNLWRETYMDFADRIYSLKIDGGYLELYEWK